MTRIARRRCWRIAAALLVSSGTAARAQQPYGLETRAPIGAYLNGVLPPRAGAFPFPPQLSAIGAFRNLQTLEPASGLIPFAPNSPLWTDGAIKTRWMAVPNDGPPYAPNEQIGFTPVGEWSFPDGTVFVKEFDMVVNEQTGARKRLETRFLVRNADGGVYGITYKWRPDESDADLLPDGLEEDLIITGVTGATRVQRYSYPSRANCLSCHNANARLVLGAKTHQLNGEFTYPETARTDNQLRTLNHLGLFDPAPDETSFATYLRSVPVSDPIAPIQHRMRSWIDANCSHCHRPGGPGPGYDGRLYTPLESQNLIDTYVRFRNVPGSLLHQRDNALDASKMPPLAKNVVHQTAMATLRQWIASPFALLSVYLQGAGNQLAVRFNSQVAPETVLASNFTLDQGLTVTAAELGDEPDVVLLTVNGLNAGQSYVLSVRNVRDRAESANTIWPSTRLAFAARFPAAPAGGRLANISTRVQVSGDERVLIGGFIARGATPKRVLLRGLGPSLAASGLAGLLADPTIELHNSSGQLLATNDNWSENANRQEIVDTGIAPLAPAESAILMTLPATTAGTAYTVVLRGAAYATGIGLVEIYDLDRNAGSELANISTRGFVQNGEDVMIGGVIVDGVEPQKVIIRGIGPSLTASAIRNPLADPTVTLVNSNGDTIAFNDNWRDTQPAEVIASTIPPPSELEAAIVATLPPARYTAIARGRNGGVGVGLIEVYRL